MSPRYQHGVLPLNYQGKPAGRVGYGAEGLGPTKARFPASSPPDRHLKRVKGIEPSWPDWKSGTLPLSYTRIFFVLVETVREIRPRRPGPAYRDRLSPLAPTTHMDFIPARRIGSHHSAIQVSQVLHDLLALRAPNLPASLHAPSLHKTNRASRI